MRKTRYSHPAMTGICRALILGAAYLGMAGCDDDTFDRFRNDKDQRLAFDITVPGSWTEAPSRAENVDDVEIVKLDASGADPLYLITETNSVPDSVVTMPGSRGAVITKSTFYDSFGLSAICYDCSASEFKPEDWTANLAHNVRMVSYGEYWQTDDKSLHIDWMGSGRVSFYAYAPYCDEVKGDKGSLTHSVKDAKGVPVIDFKVAEKVTSQIDLLSAYVDCAGSQGGNVSLEFNHALTAVTVKTGDGMLAGTVNKVTLSGVHDRGRFKIGTTEWTDQSGEATFTVEPKTVLEEDPDKKPNTSAGQDIVGTTGDLTFLMIPQTLGSDAKLTITFADKLSGAERTLTASLAGTEWKAGTRVSYSINTTGIKVIPEIDWDFQVVKPTQITAEGATVEQHKDDLFGRQIPVSGYIPEMKIKAYAKVYQLDEDEKETNVKHVRLDPVIEWQRSGNGDNWNKSEKTLKKMAETDGDFDIYGVMVEPRTVFATMQGTLARKEPLGTKQSPENLAEGGESANCYMIHAPGHYSLPLVYGNLLNRSDKDDKAYTFKGVMPPSYNYKGKEINPADYVLTNFVGYDGNYFNTYQDMPWIAGDLEAVLVWQDSPNLVSDLRIDDKKLCFEVEKNSICQGNALIAVRGKTDRTIRWSWHIWVTDKEWDNHLITLNRAVSTDEMSSYQLTPCNLGYCDPHVADSETRTYSLRLTVTLPDGTPEKKTLENIDQAEILESKAGDNTYYQFGRKDPMLPGIWNHTTVHSYVSDDFTQFNMANKPYYPGEFMFVRENHDDGRTIGYAIQNPNKFFMHDNKTNPYSEKGTDHHYRLHWHGSHSSESGNYSLNTIMNYWDSQLCKFGTENSEALGQFPTKTVYDPCPPGFCIPPNNVFRALSPDGENGKKMFVNINTGDKKYIERVGNESYTRDGVVFDYHPTQWVINSNNQKIEFPATGLRDIGQGKVVVPDYFIKTSHPAHSELTFIITSSIIHADWDERGELDVKASLFYIDERFAKRKSGPTVYYLVDENKNKITTFSFDALKSQESSVNINAGTNNAYGFTVRPVKDARSK